MRIARMEMRTPHTPATGAPRPRSTAARWFFVKALGQQGLGRRVVSFWKAHGSCRVFACWWSLYPEKSVVSVERMFRATPKPARSPRRIRPAADGTRALTNRYRPLGRRPRCWTGTRPRRCARSGSRRWPGCSRWSSCSRWAGSWSRSCTRRRSWSRRGCRS